MSVSAQSELGETRPSEVWSVELESSKKTRLRPSPTDHFYFISFQHWAAKTQDIGAGKTWQKALAGLQLFVVFRRKKGGSSVHRKGIGVILSDLRWH